jgi:hypothetical protein
LQYILHLSFLGSHPNEACHAFVLIIISFESPRHHNTKSSGIQHNGQGFLNPILDNKDKFKYLLDAPTTLPSDEKKNKKKDKKDEEYDTDMLIESEGLV